MMTTITTVDVVLAISMSIVVTMMTLIVAVIIIGYCYCYYSSFTSMIIRAAIYSSIHLPIQSFIH